MYASLKLQLTVQNMKRIYGSPSSNSQKNLVPITVTQPPAAWSDRRPESFAEYAAQIKKWLRLNDGHEAKAVDDYSVKCVCNKIIRFRCKYYWKYLIQKPTLKPDKVIQKGNDYSNGWKESK